MFYLGYNYRGAISILIVEGDKARYMRRAHENHFGVKIGCIGISLVYWSEEIGCVNLFLFFFWCVNI